MEILLLLLDEIDDAVAGLRMLWPQLLGFLLACGLFALSIMAALRWPALAAAVILLLLAVPILAGRPLFRFKTDS